METFKKGRIRIGSTGIFDLYRITPYADTVHALVTSCLHSITHNLSDPPSAIEMQKHFVDIYVASDILDSLSFGDAGHMNRRHSLSSVSSHAIAAPDNNFSISDNVS